jgi:hypothetical protein
MIGGKKWQKGRSGNPSGRPKSNFSFKKELETKLGEVNERDYLKRTYGRLLIDKAVNLALRGQGNIRAISEVLDRYVGKTGSGSNPRRQFEREPRAAYGTSSRITSNLPGFAGCQ